MHGPCERTAHTVSTLRTTSRAKGVLWAVCFGHMPQPIGALDREVGLVIDRAAEDCVEVREQICVLGHPVEVPVVDQRPQQVGAVPWWLDVMVLEKPERSDPVWTWQRQGGWGSEGKSGAKRTNGVISGCCSVAPRVETHFGAWVVERSTLIRARKMLTDRHRATRQGRQFGVIGEGEGEGEG